MATKKTTSLTAKQEIIFSVEASGPNISDLRIKATAGSENVDEHDKLIYNVPADYLWIHMVRLSTTYGLRGFDVTFKEVTKTL